MHASPQRKRTHATTRTDGAEDDTGCTSGTLRSRHNMRGGEPVGDARLSRRGGVQLRFGEGHGRSVKGGRGRGHPLRSASSPPPFHLRQPRKNGFAVSACGEGSTNVLRDLPRRTPLPCSAVSFLAPSLARGHRRAPLSLASVPLLHARHVHRVGRRESVVGTG